MGTIPSSIHWQKKVDKMFRRNISRWQITQPHNIFFFSSAHEEWGFCQAGTSALLTEDQTALIGAPGPYTWRGTVFAYSVEDDYLFRDKTHYHIPVQEGEAPVDKYAYLGMSVASGNFLPSTRTCGNRQ